MRRRSYTMSVTKLPKCMKGTAKHRQGAVGVQSRDHGWWYSRSEIPYPLTSTVTRLTVLEYSFATGVSEEANSKRVDLSTAHHDFEEPDFITSASCLPGTTLSRRVSVHRMKLRRERRGPSYCTVPFFPPFLQAQDATQRKVSLLGPFASTKRGSGPR